MSLSFQTRALGPQEGLNSPEIHQRPKMGLPKGLEKSHSMIASSPLVRAAKEAGDSFSSDIPTPS